MSFQSERRSLSPQGRNLAYPWVIDESATQPDKPWQYPQE